MTFRALVLTQGADRKVSGTIETLPEDRLPAGDVTVAVEYSTLNYKDGLGADERRRAGEDLAACRRHRLRGDRRGVGQSRLSSPATRSC